jgi:hypothetical protein
MNLAVTGEVSNRASLESEDGPTRIAARKGAVPVS